MATHADWRKDVSEADQVAYREMLESLSTHSKKAFRAVIHDDPSIFDVFLTATPVRELGAFGEEVAAKVR